LLRKLPITRPNHVWCSDITYIPVRRGFLYLVAIMDWATRKVLAWRSTIVLGPMADKVSLKHTGRQLLCRGIEESHHKIRQARNHEYPLSGIAARYPAEQWTKVLSSRVLPGSPP
jgi:transposase InsO family protein